MGQMWCTTRNSRTYYNKPSGNVLPLVRQRLDLWGKPIARTANWGELSETLQGKRASQNLWASGGFGKGTRAAMASGYELGRVLTLERWYHAVQGFALELLYVRQDGRHDQSTHRETHQLHRWNTIAQPRSIRKNRSGGSPLHLPQRMPGKILRCLIYTL